MTHAKAMLPALMNRMRASVRLPIHHVVAKISARHAHEIVMGQAIVKLLPHFQTRRYLSTDNTSMNR